MRPTRRVDYGEILKQARDQSLMTLGAANAMLDRHGRAGAQQDEADAIEAEIDELIRQQEGEVLVAIEDALRKLRETPELFGICDACGQAISARTLRISPWAAFCDEHAPEASLLELV